MSIEDLSAVYHKAFGRPPPLRASEAFVQANVRYHQQAQAQGGLKSSTVRQLIELAEGKASVKAGTKFIRSWRGSTYEVAVTADGEFIYQNQTYRSLSAIARQITGTAWNGRAFFGVTNALQHG